jgi:hypothetical protein
LPNLPPSVQFTQAPVSTDPADRAFYAYRVFWSGDDPDGRVDHFEYAIDPGPRDTLWVITHRSEEVLFFSAPTPDPVSGPVPTATGFHTLVLKAVDDKGAQSARRTRAFFSWTVAPSVEIDDPRPNAFTASQIAPSVIVRFSGQDPDGQRTQRPVRYKYRRFVLDAQSTWMLSDPDSLRRREAATGFAGWDSTGAESTFVRYQNMAPDDRFLFVVVAFDEAGAYSPVFSLDSNMLMMSVTLAAQLGPRIHVFNEFLDFTYDSGGYTADPLRWIRLEAAVGSTLRFNWEAFPAPGANIQSYRWAVDLQDLLDNAPRTDEETDHSHWSRGSPLTTSCVLAGLGVGLHLLYIEAKDNNGFASLGVVAITMVTTPLDRDVLVVDDTRLEVDKPLPTGCYETYKSLWPSAAELDTFLYARGDVPWRCTQEPASGVRTRPGVFAGYAFDTLGTRQGREVPTQGVPLRTLGRYRHVVWLVDRLGAVAPDLPLPSTPITVLRYMSAPGRASTLAAYMLAGGRVWMCGGGAGTAATDAFNDPRNDTPETPIYSNAQGELVNGRIMYDGAHWQSSFTSGFKGIAFTRSPRAEQIARSPWSHPDRWTGGEVRAPDYARLPAVLEPRDPELDPLPPTRRAYQASSYYLTFFGCEYLLEPNVVTEDVDPSPDVTRIASVLDTLYDANSTQLLRSPVPTMTWYHGRDANRFVFSGFAPWDFRRDECIALTDFVLQDLWGLSRRAVDRGGSFSGARASVPAGPTTPAQRGVASRAPARRE